MIISFIKNLIPFLLFVSLFFNGCGNDNPAEPEPPVASSLSDIEALMQYHHIPGVSIAIINNYAIDTLLALGVKDNVTLEPMTNSTMLMAGSISKPVASLCAMSFVQNGRINLYEDVNNPMLSWNVPENEYTIDEKVTLFRLLSHRSGIQAGSFQYLNYEPVPSLLQVLNGELPAVNPPVEVTFPPGSEFLYSNLGYCVMEQLLADLTGKSFFNIAKETIFDPLGMNNSSFEQLVPDERGSDYSSGHYLFGDVVPGKYKITSVIAAGGLWTTAEDLAKFIIEVQLSFKDESNKILSKEFMDLWDTPATQISTVLNENYGLGISNYKVGIYSYFGHGGQMEGFSGRIFASKNYGCGGVVLTNYNDANDFPQEIINLIAELYDWRGY